MDEQGTAQERIDRFTYFVLRQVEAIEAVSGSLVNPVPVESSESGERSRVLASATVTSPA